MGGERTSNERQPASVSRTLTNAARGGRTGKATDAQHKRTENNNGTSRDEDLQHSRLVSDVSQPTQHEKGRQRTTGPGQCSAARAGLGRARATPGRADDGRRRGADQRRATRGEESGSSLTPPVDDFSGCPWNNISLCLTLSPLSPAFAAPAFRVVTRTHGTFSDLC